MERTPLRAGGLRTLRTVAGCDVSVRENRLWGAVLLFSFPDLRPMERAWAVREAEFPYVPGFLSFREIPVLLDAFAQLRRTPDVVLCDGQGIAHPRRLGLASHLGLLLDLPTIGCAKSRLVGRHEDPGDEVGDRTPLLDGRETIGAVVRTRARTKPLYVSIGHRVRLTDAVRLVLACGRGRRLPEPTRQADRTVGLLSRGLPPPLFDPGAVVDSPRVVVRVSSTSATGARAKRAGHSADPPPRSRSR